MDLKPSRQTMRVATMPVVTLVVHHDLMAATGSDLRINAIDIYDSLKV